MFVELTDAINKCVKLINKNHVTSITPREEVEPYGLKGVTEIETFTSKIYVVESLDEVKNEFIRSGRYESPFPPSSPKHGDVWKEKSLF